jgi:hypothetical protein
MAAPGPPPRFRRSCGGWGRWRSLSQTIELGDGVTRL